MIKWPELNNHLRRILDLEGNRRFELGRIASAANPADHALIFAAEPDDATLTRLQEVQGSVIILPAKQREHSLAIAKTNGVIFSDNPRYRFAEILNAVVATKDLRGELTLDTRRHIFIGKNVTIDPAAVVEPGATIAMNSRIAAGAYVMSGARIGPSVVIGRSSVIKENCVVGGWGFGYALAPGKPPLRLPHLGGVVIGDHCEVGSFTTVCSGTIEPTVIHDHAKIDDHVHIAHNCVIGEGAMVVACAEVSGSVKVGSRSWLGPNCAIIDRITIGDDCVVGIGAVVRKSLPDGSTVAGNPAKGTDELKRQSEMLKQFENFVNSRQV